MKRKAFKTVKGYLRSAEGQLWAAQGKARLAGRAIISDDDGYRQIINNLLARRGFADRIGEAERPRAGIVRIRQTPTNTEAQAKLLETCQQFIEQAETVSAAMDRITMIGVRESDH